MPNVAGKKFPYTKKGKADAKKAKKKKQAGRDYRKTGLMK
tara:strand:+ start:557 stop:676 length:120 start_codon:yes stop_codon:yes gene_type:complete